MAKHHSPNIADLLDAARRNDDPKDPLRLVMAETLIGILEELRKIRRDGLRTS